MTLTMRDEPYATWPCVDAPEWPGDAMLQDEPPPPTDPLHPTGRCTCCGDGACAWCKTPCEHGVPRASYCPTCTAEAEREVIRERSQRARAGLIEVGIIGPHDEHVFHPPTNRLEGVIIDDPLNEKPLTDEQREKLLEWMTKPMHDKSDLPEHKKRENAVLVEGCKPMVSPLSLITMMAAMTVTPNTVLMPHEPREPEGNGIQVPKHHPDRPLGCASAPCRTLDDCLCSCKQCKAQCR